MGEWLSQWSAKPFTAVRIRFRPHSFKKHLCKSSIYEGVFIFTQGFTYKFGAEGNISSIIIKCPQKFIA